MEIHKSYSKSDIIYLCKQLGIELDKKDNKNQIILNIIELITSRSHEFNFDNNDFKLKNIGDLIIYLKSENKECKIDSIEKEIVMNKAKKIIHFGKCDYNIQGTNYNNINEIFSDCLYISKYGFIPSVRRACKIHNDCIFKVDHVNPALPLKIQREIESKKKMKCINNYNCTMKRGEFILTFD